MGFGIWGLGLRVAGLGLPVEVLGVRVQTRAALPGPPRRREEPNAREPKRQHRIAARHHVLAASSGWLAENSRAPGGRDRIRTARGEAGTARVARIANRANRDSRFDTPGDRRPDSARKHGTRTMATTVKILCRRQSRVRIIISNDPVSASTRHESRAGLGAETLRREPPPPPLHPPEGAPALSAGDAQGGTRPGPARPRRGRAGLLGACPKPPKASPGGRSGPGRFLAVLI